MKKDTKPLVVALLLISLGACKKTDTDPQPRVEQKDIASVDLLCSPGPK